MKKRKPLSIQVKIISIILMIMTAIAVVIIIKGVLIVYDVNKTMSDGLSATRDFLRDSKPEDGNSVEAEEEDSFIDNPKNGVGFAIITIFSGDEYSAAVYNGVTVSNLRLGVARADETAYPGRAGNCVIYGHRDSAFRCLKDIKIGDKVVVKTKKSEYVFYVEKTQICLPESEAITQPYASPYLTLVTCYPFIYSGPAVERYVVTCRLQSE